MKRVRVSSGRALHFEDDRPIRFLTRETLCGWPVNRDYDAQYDSERRVCGPCIVEAYRQGLLVEAK